MVDLTAYRLPLMLAVLLHCGVVALLTIGWTPESSEVAVSAKIKAIDARLVSVQDLPKPKAQLKAKPKPKPKAKPMIEPSKPQRIETESLEPEPLEPEPLEPKPPEPKPKEVAPTVKQLAAEEVLMASMSSESKADIDKDQHSLVARYAGMISQQMQQRWQLPPSARRDMVCLVKIRLSVSGSVVAVTLASSSGSDAFDQSSLLAVKKAGDFRFIKNLPAVVFDQHFREFVFRFSAEDLRL
ncbi:MAG: hypothetical protein CL691_00725 [Cellvibrionales bacterium]|nr:hypothetical protein [Cellvibrionales bacterium]|tara:strand:+ start:7145 stop:7867 length:723 start_codon:yes stop_codon:yes gene_type:complete